MENEVLTGKIEQVNIDQQMRSAYIDYSMSVIVSRALPDVRDGFKPVHRRVLFGMDGLGLSYSGQTKKSARIVGEVLGNHRLVASESLAHLSLHPVAVYGMLEVALGNAHEHRGTGLVVDDGALHKHNSQRKRRHRTSVSCKELVYQLLAAYTLFLG